MARKAKVEPIFSANYEVIIAVREGDGVQLWHVRCRNSCADTNTSWDLDAYRALKKLWRKKKAEFDDKCKKMRFHDLFSNAGVKL